MKLLVIGGSGMLGVDLIAEAMRRGHDIDARSSAEFNIADPMCSAQLAQEVGKFDWCLNCAAYTAVDKAESEPQLAFEVNTLGPGYLANACSLAGTKIIHISTDFVFDGESTTPYSEDAPTNPIAVYGQTKREGELAVLRGNTNALVVRTSWLFGVHGRSFPRTMITAWRAGRNLRVVNDQVGCPTYTVDLARVLIDLVERNAYPGVYHATGSDITNWHAFAMDAITAWKRMEGDYSETFIEAIPTSAYPTPAKRPTYSVLSHQKLVELGIAEMRSCEEALEAFVRDLELGA